MNMMLPMSVPVTREVEINYVDGRPKRHKWYKYLAKIGTHSGTVVWIADKEVLAEGDVVWVTEIDMSDKGLWVKYLSDTALFRGTVTNISEEPRAFISR